MFNTAPILCFSLVQVASSVPGYPAVFPIPHTNASLKRAANDWCAGGERKEAAKRMFGPIEEWGVFEVTSMYALFQDQAEFNEDLSKWRVGKVTSMRGTFSGATAFNCDLSGWDVSKVTDMSFTFRGATAFDQTLSGAWSTSTASKLNMFSNCPGSILKVLVTRTRAPTETRTRTRTHQPDPPAAQTALDDYSDATPENKSWPRARAHTHTHTRTRTTQHAMSCMNPLKAPHPKPRSQVD